MSKIQYNDLAVEKGLSIILEAQKELDNIEEELMQAFGEVISADIHGYLKFQEQGNQLTDMGKTAKSMIEQLYNTIKSKSEELNNYVNLENILKQDSEEKEILYSEEYAPEVAN